MGIHLLYAQRYAQEIWEGRRPGIEGAIADWPIDNAHSVNDIDTILSKMIASSSRVMHRMGINSKVDNLVVEAIKKETGQGKG